MAIAYAFTLRAMTFTSSFIFALLLVPFAAVHADPVSIIDRQVIFKHTHTDAKAADNASGHNLGPSVAVLPDGRVMAVWFSAPSEGAASQRIMQAFSSDQGRTWGAASVLQDFEGRPDFDPVLLVAGKETFLFFSSFDPQLDIYVRRSHDSGVSWSEPQKLNQPNHTTRSNGIQLTTGELLVPLHLRGTKAGGVMKSSDGGTTWSEPILLADRPTKTPGWSICYPTLTEIPDGTVLAIWAQVKSTSTVLYGDIHSARLKLSVAGAR